MNKYFIQEYSYIENPYFTGSGQALFNTTGNIAIYEAIASLDAVVNYATRSFRAVAKSLWVRDIQNGINLLKRIIDKNTQYDHELRTVLIKIIDHAELYLLNYVKSVNAQRLHYVKGVSGGDLSLYKGKINFMEENGYLDLSFELNDEFNKWSSTQLTEAREKYKSESDWRGANSYSPKNFGYGIINEFIKQNHIIEIISAYKKMDMRFYYAAWDYAHHRQQWFRNNHEFGHLSPTNYYHYDGDVDVAKMLIYLTDVKEGDGAFRFVKGSNTMPRSITMTALNYAVDTQINKLYNTQGDLYGRGLFLNRKDLLMKFPIAFMGTTHFGDDLIEGSPLAKYLLDNTIIFYRPAGTAVLFDGYLGIHAGGNADKGERLAIQVAFKQKLNSSGSVWKKPVAKLKSMLQKFNK